MILCFHHDHEKAIVASIEVEYNQVRPSTAFVQVTSCLRMLRHQTFNRERTQSRVRDCRWLEGRLTRVKMEGLGGGATEFGGGVASRVVIVEEERFLKLIDHIVREKLKCVNV
jgi:hypothetical protein